MYWDALEVRAVSNHRLWLRFADGVTGTLQLNANEFTGVLEQLNLRKAVELQMATYPQRLKEVTG